MVTAVAVAVGALVFRGQVASGLVTRGDDFLRFGSLERAQLYYARALWIDPGSAVAAERFAFAGLMRKTPSALRRAAEVASAALRSVPGDRALLTDLALCRNALGEYHAARADFEQLARGTGDPGYYEFAAQAARRAGEIATAERLFARVIAIDPRFDAARRELRRLRTAR